MSERPPRESERKTESKGNLPPPFIVTRMGGVHEWGNLEVIVFPRIVEAQWLNTVGSTLWGIAPVVAVVLDIVLGPAEITPASCQPLQAAWSSLLGVRSSICGMVAFRGPCRSGSCVHQRWRGTRQSGTPLDGVLACALGGPGDTWRSRTPRGGEVRDTGCVC